MFASAPGHPVATLGLAQVELIRRVNPRPGQNPRGGGRQPRRSRGAGPRRHIDVALGRIEAGFDRLLDTIRRTSGEEHNQARLHLIGLFDAFPPRDPRVTKARATLSSLLVWNL